jgi:hypothetical protein
MASIAENSKRNHFRPDMNADAVMNELAYQRMLLGDRAAQLAGQLATVTAELKAAKEELERLKKQE